MPLLLADDGGDVQDPSELAQKLGMTNEQDREYLGRRIKRLKRNPQLSFSSSFSSFDFSHSAISLQALAQIGTYQPSLGPRGDLRSEERGRTHARATTTHHRSEEGPLRPQDVLPPGLAGKDHSPVLPPRCVCGVVLRVLCVVD